MYKTLTWTMVAIGAGYGAWTLYKKYNPTCAQDIKNSIEMMSKKMSKNATKNIENMM